MSNDIENDIINLINTLSGHVDDDNEWLIVEVQNILKSQLQDAINIEYTKKELYDLIVEEDNVLDFYEENRGISTFAFREDIREIQNDIIDSFCIESKI